MSAPASPNSKPCIGLVGIGLLGSALGERLLQDGFPVLGFDVTEERRAAFRSLGGTIAAAAAEVFTRADRVVLSLPSHVEVGAVIAANRAALRSGRIIVDTTTGDPASTVTMAADLAARGVAYLDATVSGSSTQVRQGAAVMMVGGEKAAFEACADIFAALVGETFHTGPAGTGAKMKLVTNLVLGLNRAVLAEGLALAEGLSLDPKLALAILRRSPAYSRAMDTKGEKMIRGEFLPEARLAQHLKDVRLIVEAGAEAGLPMPLSREHREILEAAVAAGLGELDNSAVIRALAARKTNPAPV